MTKSCNWVVLPIAFLLFVGAFVMMLVSGVMLICHHSGTWDTTCEVISVTGTLCDQGAIFTYEVSTPECNNTILLPSENCQKTPSTFNDTCRVDYSCTEVILGEDRYEARLTKIFLAGALCINAVIYSFLAHYAWEKWERKKRKKHTTHSNPNTDDPVYMALNEIAPL
eukprot:TRINITY_DN9155_c0_g1_i1.p1 TRINITY_DN9155_c0_g1~~TRINITY_DN9155_c0_g1_i1.p1  ORF type:complete len:168 (+),score=23.94 TRINITY_DN9155_c0_g1_i1:76-579(+)